MIDYIVAGMLDRIRWNLIVLLVLGVTMTGTCVHLAHQLSEARAMCAPGGQR